MSLLTQNTSDPGAASFLKSESSTKEAGVPGWGSRNLTGDPLDRFGLGGHSGLVARHTLH